MSFIRIDDDGGFKKLSGTIPREPTPWGAVWTPEQVNDDPYFGVAEPLAARRRDELARSREAYARKLLRHRLPRRLRWTLGHPRTLRRLLRVIRRWEPTMNIVPLNCYTTPAGAVEASERWLKEQEARGRDVSGGYVFTYTDAGGLPSEVYGP